MLRARVATAAVAIPVLLLLILYPSPWPLTLLIVAVGAVGLGEYAAMAFPQRRGERVLTVACGTLLAAAAAAATTVNLPHLLAAAATLTIVAGLTWTLLGRPDFDAGLRDLGLSLIGVFYIGLLLPHFVWLHGLEPHGPQWVIFVVFISMAGDTGGYAVGHAFGRHRLMPRVSPGKTIEGAAGIIAVSLLAGAAAKLVFLREYGWQQILGLAGTMAVLGQLGDLGESVMKRTFGVKESGWLFPGHGGVLDRVDSLLFPVVFLYYHVLLFN